MEQTELRLGNYLFYRGQKEAKVSSIGTNGFETTYIGKDQPNGSDDLGEYRPIPLTEECLVRFGIHIDGQSISLKSGTIGVIQRGREGMFKYYLQSAFGMVHLDSIKYVHQLQNLYFALTGEELELKQ